MKNFKNKSTELTEKGQELGFAGLAKCCLDTTPEKGWDPQSIRLSLACEAKIAKSKIGDTIKFEDAEFNYLFQMSQPDNMRWAMKHQDIVDYSEYLDEVKSKK